MRNRAIASVGSINVSDGGVPKLPRRTAMIRTSGVEGDRQRDLRFHGGPDRAVSLYSLDLVDALRAEGHPIVPGSIGENLTFSGVHWSDVVPGARLQVGQVELEVVKYAHPCQKIVASFRDADSTRVSQKVHPGWSRVYARVRREGLVSVDDAVEITQDYVVTLGETIDRAVPVLAAMAGEPSRRRPSPEKWSPREVIGHLIDSASNNHQRFVRAQVDGTARFDGYLQDRWVDAQRYHDAPWDELLTLWAFFNRHLARVMAATPAGIRHRLVEPNNFAALAWNATDVAATPTLDAFMRDYVGHLRHHLRQVLGEDW
jgi:MOSC domain-containing protein YiiM